MFHYKNQTGIFWAYFLYSSPYPLSSRSRRFWLRICRRRQQSDRGGKNESIGALWSPSFCRDLRLCGPGQIVIDYGIPIEDAGVFSDDSRVSIEETDLASGLLTIQISGEINTGEGLTLSGFASIWPRRMLSGLWRT